MALPHFVLLYVDEPQASAAFYARMLERQPLDSSPNFVMFELSPGLRLGLWARRGVEPAPGGAAGAGELAMAVGTSDEVEALCADSEAQRRDDPAGAGHDGLRPDLPRRRPGRTPASRVLPCALSGPSGLKRGRRQILAQQIADLLDRPVDRSVVLEAGPRERSGPAWGRWW